MVGWVYALPPATLFLDLNLFLHLNRPVILRRTNLRFVMQLQQYNQNCFKLSGYLAASPTLAPLCVGDFAQVSQGQAKVLGNLLGVNFANEIIINETAITAKDSPWVLSEGVEHQQKLQQSDGLAVESANLGSWQKNIYQFKSPESFIFHGKEGINEGIGNWNDVSSEVTLRLTQSHYSFRQVLVITEVLRFDQWGLAIAAKANGQLELALQADMQLQGHDAHAVLSHQQRVMQSSRNMYFAGAGDDSQRLFYRAKMLVLSDALQDRARNDIIQNQHLTPTMRANWLTSDSINGLSANTITVNNCIDSFVWRNLTPDMMTTDMTS